MPADVARRWDFSRDGILRSVEASLERTGLDRFDILYLHDPDDHFEQASTEGIGALIELREQGLVTAVGAGMNHAAPLAELIRRADVDLVMCAGRFTLIDDEALQELLPLALARGVGVVAAAVYNSGMLSTPRPAPGATVDYLPAPAELIAPRQPHRGHLRGARCDAPGCGHRVRAAASGGRERRGRRAWRRGRWRKRWSALRRQCRMRSGRDLANAGLVSQP